MTFTDSFTEATDTNLVDHTPDTGTAWLVGGGAENTAIVLAASDTLKANSSGFTLPHYLCSPDQGADAYVQARLKTIETGVSLAVVCVRIQDEDNWIGWSVSGSGAAGLRLKKSVAGVVTDLVTFQSVLDAVYRVEANGTTIKIFEDGAQKGTDVTVSEISTEATQGLKLQASTSGAWIDDFEAGALGGGGATVTLPTITSTNLFDITSIVVPPIVSLLEIVSVSTVGSLTILAEKLISLAEIESVSTVDAPIVLIPDDIFLTPFASVNSVTGFIILGGEIVAIVATAINDRLNGKLGQLGYVGTINERCMDYLLNKGYTGSFNERLNADMKANSIYSLHQWMNAVAEGTI